MSANTNKRVVDTNVPVTANQTTKPNHDSDVPLSCIERCIQVIQNITGHGGLVVDVQGEIFEEYLRHLSLSGQPGVGDVFVKWVHDNQHNGNKVDRVPITKKGESYEEFPSHDGLLDFDNSDRKFLAAANAHAEKPPIVQATDSKWWGWKNALEESDIEVDFICREYVEERYERR